MLDILCAGGDDVRLLSKMHDDMAKFRWLMDTAAEAGMNELFSRFAAAIESGEIEVPK